MLETFTIKHFNSMSLHEFTTVFLFYLTHDKLINSPALLQVFLDKLEKSVSEFNELHLQLFLKSIISFAVRNADRFDRSKFEKCVEAIDVELDGIRQEKEFLMSEDKLREMI